MTPISKFKWTIVLIMLHFVLLGYFYSVLPADAKVPMHWNINNEIDGYSGKTTAMLFGAGMSLGMFLLLYLMPLYSPWYRRYQKRFESYTPALCFVLILFFALINLYSLWLAKTGVELGFHFILVLMGLLFIFLGNILPKTPRNFFIGYKLPWTLSDEENWYRTHRLAGKLFLISGIIMIAKAFILPRHLLFQQFSGAVAFGIVLYPVLYSFLLFRHKNKAKT